ncbi:hypothetical protein QJQ45_018595 [Haematococcus lacustris]|nr:hypothetical protein QJQ45_018595 [Haematococcus lacustris]
MLGWGEGEEEWDHTSSTGGGHGPVGGARSDGTFYPASRLREEGGGLPRGASSSQGAGDGTSQDSSSSSSSSSSHQGASSADSDSSSQKQRSHRGNSSSHCGEKGSGEEGQAEQDMGPSLGPAGGGGATLKSRTRRKIVSGGALTYTYELEEVQVSGGGGSTHTTSSSTVSLTDKRGRTTTFEFKV